MNEPRRVAVALYSIASGAAGGAALATAGTASSRTILGLGLDPSNVVILSGVLGVAVAVEIGWTQSRGMAEAWRRGVICVLAAFGAGLLGIAAVGVDMFFPQMVVVAYLVGLLAVAVLAARRAGRARSSGAAGG